MTADLAVPSGGTVNPGSLYGRSGPRPRALLEASAAAETAARSLRDQLSRCGAAPLGGCVPVAAELRKAARIYTACLTKETLIAATALTPDLARPRPAVAEAARADLQLAARAAGAAGSEAFTAWRSLRAAARAGAEPEDPAVPSPAAVISTAGALAAQLKAAAGQVIPASEPVIHGHATVIYHMALALTALGSASASLADLAWAVPRSMRGQNKVGGPLHEAARLFGQAGRHSLHAHSVLAETAGIIRKAPAGYPCADCTGTGVSRLGGGPCGRCRGSGIDVRAMRPVTG